MTPLIDGDVLLHELGWSSQFTDKETGEELLFDAEYACNLLDEKIRIICEEVDATNPPQIYLSSSPTLSEMYNKRNKYTQFEHHHVDNFRYEVAVTKPYKGTRKNPKPFHFYNLASHFMTHYDTYLSSHGLEADDELGIAQTSLESTIICSRDKDLRMIPGWHYSWECGVQRAVGPHFTDPLGSLERTNKKVKGYGLKFFFFQMLCGDAVDNIPGLPKLGEVKAFNIIDPLNTEEEMFTTVRDLYKEVMGDEAKTYFQEQKKLLWIAQDEMMEYRFNG